MLDKNFFIKIYELVINETWKNKRIEVNMILQSISHELPEWYKRYVDDHFRIFNGYSPTNSFLDTLNNLQPSLKFTREYDKDNKLFLDRGY